MSAEPIPTPPTWTRATARSFLDFLAEHAGEHAGIPMPIRGLPIRVHKSYPFAEIVSRGEAKPSDSEEENLEAINSWYSMRHGAEIVMIRERDTGRITYGKIPAVHHAAMMINTFGACADAHSIETESVAIRKLATLVKPHTFQSYLLTGAFIETSKRSGVSYVFRRLRPTLALKAPDGSDEIKILCALCLHPIGYYEGTWAGCMVPTDEVIAHLMLMRGDEHEFWKQANQHASWRPEAGI